MSRKSTKMRVALCACLSAATLYAGHAWAQTDQSQSSDVNRYQDSSDRNSQSRDSQASRSSDDSSSRRDSDRNFSSSSNRNLSSQDNSQGFQSPSQSNTQRDRDSQFGSQQFGNQRDRNSQFGRDSDRSFGWESDRASGRDRGMSDRGGNPPAGLGVYIEEGDRGVRVVQVYPNSPAQQAGLRTGDEILRVSGQTVDSASDFVSAVQQRQPGDTIELTVQRDGRIGTLRARLEPRDEALEQDPREGRGFRSFAPATPWSDDEVSEHVQALEQEIRRLTDEIQELKSMLSNNPSLQPGRSSGQNSNSSADRP